MFLLITTVGNGQVGFDISAIYQKIIDYPYVNNYIANNVSEENMLVVVFDSKSDYIFNNLTFNGQKIKATNSLSNSLSIQFNITHPKRHNIFNTNRIKVTATINNPTVKSGKCISRKSLWFSSKVKLKRDSIKLKRVKISTGNVSGLLL